MPHQKVASDEELLADLRRIAAIAPKLNSGDIERHGKYNRRTYLKRIGTLEQIRRAAGVITEQTEANFHLMKERLKTITDWTEEECVALFRKFRWPQEITCPRCNESEGVTRLKNQRLTNPEIALYGCLDCLYQFSDISGTFFHQSPTPLKQWFLVIIVFVGAPHLSTQEQADLIGEKYGRYWAKVDRLRGSKMVLELAEHLNQKTRSQRHEQNRHHL